MDQGLTAAEVADRVRRGLVNDTPAADWLMYLHIVGRNFCTWFNAMVTPAAAALFILEEYQGAMAVSGMAVVNTALGLAQELRAKHHLDKLAILVEARVKVVRDAKVQEVSAGAVVLGDHILLAGGDPVVADGPVLEARYLEVDEALLTGEADPVRRHPGQTLLSGSICVAGDGVYRADKVGSQAFATQMSVKARRYDAAASPLTRVINRLVQLLSYTAVGLIILFTTAYVLGDWPKSDFAKRAYVRMVAATITSMVPQGMVLTATIAFMLGAVVLSRRGAIVQRLQAVEAMAAIDVICTDKTGTLTTNHLRLEKVDMLVAHVSDAAVRHRLQAFVSASMDCANRNIQAIQRGLGPVAAHALAQIPFKAQNRYSAAWVRAEEYERVLVLGALEALASRIGAWEQNRPGARVVDRLASTAAALQARGLRLLVFAEAEPHFDLGERTTLPEAPLCPLALVSLGDDLRPEAGPVLAALAAQGIAFKVLSGDNAETVGGMVRHVDLPLAHERVVSGAELAAAADPAALVRTHSVFGRVSPEQKVFIVQTLQEAGHYVAMIGDGVNDVLPIKQADLGIAMGEGSQAAKTVAGLVLQGNNFDLLPETLEEGRTIVRNLRRSAKLFLVKNVYSLILILAYASGLFGMPFPYVPQQVTLLNWLVIGLPALVIALSRERSAAATKPHFLREVGWFAIRTGVVFGLAGLAIMGIGGMQNQSARVQRTLLLSLLILLGVTALWRTLRDGESKPVAGDTRFRFLGILAIPVYLLAMYVPVCAQFFELEPLRASAWGWVLLVGGAAYAATLVSDVVTATKVQGFVRRRGRDHR